MPRASGSRRWRAALGYTVAHRGQHRARNSCGEAASGAGMPAMVRVGFTDAVKSDDGSKAVLRAAGHLLHRPEQRPSAGGTFIIRRGYKSWGGNGVSYNNPALQSYFNFLSTTGCRSENCFNLDHQNPDNIGKGDWLPRTKASRRSRPTACARHLQCSRMQSSGRPVCAYPKRQTWPGGQHGRNHQPGRHRPRASTSTSSTATTGMLFFYVCRTRRMRADVGRWAVAAGSRRRPGLPRRDRARHLLLVPAAGLHQLFGGARRPELRPRRVELRARAGGSIYSYANGRYELPEPADQRRLAYVVPQGVSGAPVAPGQAVQRDPANRGRPAFERSVATVPPYCPTGEQR